MNWIEFTVYTSECGTELLGGVFARFGLDMLEIGDGEAGAQRFLIEQSANWDLADINDLKYHSIPQITVYVENSPQNVTMLSELREAILRFAADTSDIDFGSLEFSETIIDDEDWSNNWKKYYKPVKIGEGLLVCPSWEQADNDENRCLLRIDPGLAFGTGLHETTRMCLVALERHLKRGDSVADLGCGSGILSIAAKLMGAEDTISVDIDSIAVGVTKENGRLNSFELPVFRGDVIGDENFFNSIKREGGYDIVLANIVADVLIALAPCMSDLIRPGGLLISSGIIRDRQNEVIECYKRFGLKTIETVNEGEWVMVTAELSM